MADKLRGGTTIGGYLAWHSGNMGAGSGLDAGLLGGLDSAHHLDWTNTTNKPDPVITLGGDATGSVTLTDLASGTLTLTIVDDSHNHITSNIDGLDTALSNKQPIDADLTAIAALAGTTGLLKKTALNTWALDTTAYSTTLGTVTSVSGAGTVSGLTLTGTITSTGSLTLGGTLSVTASNFSSQTAKTFLAAPNGIAGTPTFRTILATDVPTLNQSTTGNATTATSAGKWTTVRTLTLSGDVAGSVSFDGSTAINMINTVIADDSHNHITSNIDGLDTALGNKIESSLIGAVNGLAQLDASGLVPSTQLPSYVDDVIIAANLVAIQALVLASGVIYVAEDTNITYRWSGTATTMVEISSSLALGTTSSTAYRGDLGNTAYQHSLATHAPSNADNTALNETSHLNVVVDASYVHTDNNFTSILKTAYDGAVTHAGTAHAPSNADNTALNETSHLNVVVDASYVHTDNNLTNTLKTNYDSAYSHSISSHAPSNADNTAANETSHATVVDDSDFNNLTSGFLKKTSAGVYTVDNSTYLTSETSHPADALVAQDITDIGNLSGTNTGDQDLSSYAPLDSPSFTTLIEVPNTINLTNGDIYTWKLYHGVGALQPFEIKSGSTTKFKVFPSSDLLTLETNSTITYGSNTVAFTASPALTGIPTAPTAVAATNTTQLATTAFVQQEIIDAAGGLSTTTDYLTTVANETVITATYNIDHVEVFVSGIKVHDSLYVATNGTSITLDFGVDIGTWVQVVSNSETPGISYPWNSVTGTPTTVAGYGITDAPSIPNATGKAGHELGTDGTVADALSWNPIRSNPNTLTADYTMDAGTSGSVVSGFTIANGVTLTIPTGSVLSIV